MSRHAGACRGLTVPSIAPEKIRLCVRAKSAVMRLRRPVLAENSIVITAIPWYACADRCCREHCLTAVSPTPQVRDRTARLRYRMQHGSSAQARHRRSSSPCSMPRRSPASWRSSLPPTPATSASCAPRSRCASRRRSPRAAPRSSACCSRIAMAAAAPRGCAGCRTRSSACSTISRSSTSTRRRARRQPSAWRSSPPAATAAG